MPLRSKFETEKSKEKNISFKGKVVGEPILSMGDLVVNPGVTSLSFPIELEANIEFTFKKSGSMTLNRRSIIIVSLEGGAFFRKSDDVHLKGRVIKITHPERPPSLHVASKWFYNETLNSFISYDKDMDWENSIEKDILIKGRVISRPMESIDVNLNFLLSFLVELEQPLNVKFQKHGSISLLKGDPLVISCYKKLYFEEGDVLEMTGRIILISLEGKQSYYFDPAFNDSPYNMTMEFYYSSK